MKVSSPRFVLRSSTPIRVRSSLPSSVPTTFSCSPRAKAKTAAALDNIFLQTLWKLSSAQFIWIKDLKKRRNLFLRTSLRLQKLSSSKERGLTQRACFKKKRRSTRTPHRRIKLSKNRVPITTSISLLESTSAKSSLAKAKESRSKTRSKKLLVMH